MQKYSVSSDPEERRVVRQWRVGVLAIYGSIVCGLLALSAIADRPTQVAASTERLTTGIAAPR